MVTRHGAGAARGEMRLRDGSQGRWPFGQAEFTTFLDSLPDAIIGVDEEGVIRLVNQHTEQLFGYERNELLGLPIEILVPQRFRSTHPVHRARYVADPRTRPMGAGVELWGRRRNGAEFSVDIALSSIETPQGLLVMAAVRDVSD